MFPWPSVIDPVIEQKIIYITVTGLGVASQTAMFPWPFASAETSPALPRVYNDSQDTTMQKVKPL